MRDLVDFFGANRSITTITVAETIDFQEHLRGSKLAATKVKQRLRFICTFFDDARRRKLIKENPLAALSSKSVINVRKRKFVIWAEPG